MATIVAGPAATKYLGDFGADVVKSSPRAGIRPGAWASDDDDDSFLEAGRAQQKVRDPGPQVRPGPRAHARAVASADALVENFRPGTLERLGLGPDVLLERNPRLVVLRVTGFGQTGSCRPARLCHPGRGAQRLRRHQRGTRRTAAPAPHRHHR